MTQELAEDPCSLKWWVQLVGFALRISVVLGMTPLIINLLIH